MSAAELKRATALSMSLTRMKASARPQVRERVLRIEVDDLLEDVDGVAIAPGALEARRHLVVGGERVAREAELGVDLGEARDDVPEAVLHVGTCLLMISRICL